MGVSTSARGPLPVFSLRLVRRCKVGNKKAAVLPEPVWADAMMSRWAKAAGMACACTGVGDS